MTCICHAAIPDDRTLCQTCAHRLDTWLGNVPAWLDELETTLTGAKSLSIVPRGTPSMQPVSKSDDDGPEESPLHYNEKAGDLYRKLVGELAVMCRAYGEPAGTPAAMSRKLMWHSLATHADAPTWLRRLDRLSDQIAHLIDVTAPRQYLGTCTVTEPDGTPCGGGIYAAHAAPTGHCDTCRAEYDTAESRAILEDALDSRLYTAEEIAGLSVYLGLREGRDRVEKRVNTWHRRGLILAHATNDNGDPMFTYGDVRNRLATLEQQ